MAVSNDYKYYTFYITKNGKLMTGLSPFIDVYTSLKTGLTINPKPTITEIGSGLYTFIATPSEPTVARVDTGLSSSPDIERYKIFKISQYDGYLDEKISTIDTAIGVVYGDTTGIKTKTDLLQFSVSNDVKATLDGETVTASSVTDKTGYSLSGSQVFDTTGNYYGDVYGDVTGSIATVLNPVTAGTVTDKTGYTVSTVQDKTGYSLSSSQVFDTTGNIFGSITSIVNPVTVSHINANVIDSTSLSDDAIVKIQNGLSTSSEITSDRGSDARRHAPAFSFNALGPSARLA